MIPMTAVYPGVWRWETPDPEDDWMMVGHALTTPAGVVLVDPPVVPGIQSALAGFGSVLGVVLTTHDHLRGAEWFHRTTGAPVHLPRLSYDQPGLRDRLSRARPYDDGDELPGGLQAHRIRVPALMWDDGTYVDEMTLTTPDGGALLTGDVVMGTPTGQLWACPEGLTLHPDPRKVTASLTTFREVLAHHPSIHTLLASHGTDLIGSVAAAADQHPSRAPV
ncbi:MAG: hypothetical protein M0Z54_05735 [Thermaerobacter sp.]|nr:hypothetical protein [Thermaerobacter sp.]